MMANITDVIVNVSNRNITVCSLSTVATDGVNVHIQQVKPGTNHGGEWQRFVWKV